MSALMGTHLRLKLAASDKSSAYPFSLVQHTTQRAAYRLFGPTFPSRGRPIQRAASVKVAAMAAAAVDVKSVSGRMAEVKQQGR